MALLLPIGITLLTAGALALSREGKPKTAACTFTEADRLYASAILNADLADLLKREVTPEKPNPTRADVAASIRLLADRAEARGCLDEAQKLRAKANQVEGGQ